MNRPRRLFVLVGLATAIAACSAEGLGSFPSASPTAVPSASPTLSPSPTPNPTETPSSTESATDPATVLAANGIGPYVVGASLADLQAQGLVTISTGDSVHCDDSWQHAGATGRYAERLSLAFHLGRLVGMSGHSIELVTPSGGRVGTPLTELQSIYGSGGKLITGWMGNQGFSVRVPDTDLGIMFYLDETNTRASVIGAGQVQRMEDLVANGEGC